jgi:NAD(P)-dependent dehydrogenase (short-subunit alcohol dehydrogenase family)
MSRFLNKVAVVTGAGSGIGKTIVKAYAEQGAKVIVSDINDEHGHAVVKAIQDLGGTAYHIKANTADPEQVEALIAKNR